MEAVVENVWSNARGEELELVKAKTLIFLQKLFKDELIR